MSDLGRAEGRDEHYEVCRGLRCPCFVDGVGEGIRRSAIAEMNATVALEAWRELALALDAYAAAQRVGRMPGKTIDRVSAAKAAVARLEEQ